MDGVETLIESVRQMSPATDAEGWTQVRVIEALEDHVADPRVWSLFVAVIADPAAYDIARIECIKILHLWPPDSAAGRHEVGRTVAAVLRDDDDDYLVRQYAAMSLGPYAEDAVVLDALAHAVHHDDDIDIRYNALASIEEAGRNDRGIELLRQLADDPELGTAVTRKLGEWLSQEDTA
jgi:hypothetical protein